MKAQNTVEKPLMESKSKRAFQYANRVARTAPGRFLLAGSLVIGLIGFPLLAKGDQTNEKKKLTGNWMGTVTRLNPPPGQPADVLSLMTFFEDGNLIQEGSDPSIRSAGHGKWEKIGHQQFSQEFLNLRFDAARNYLGTRVVTSTLTLSADGNQYQAETVAQTFDTSGNLLTTGLATEVAKRLF